MAKYIAEPPPAPPAAGSVPPAAGSVAAEPIVSPAGAISVIDLNAWPSFALFRSVAAAKIAALLAARFSRAAVAIGASR